MKSLKKYQVLFIFVLFAIVFYLFQLSFINQLKIDKISNPKIFKIREFHATKETKLSQNFLLNNKTELLIPLNSYINVQLIDFLPFNQRIEYLIKLKKNFKIQKSIINQYFDSKKLLTIEYENHDNKSRKIFPILKIRGIDKNKLHLYHSRVNKFKCLNSNVCNF